MYQKGETTYNALKELSERPGKYVFVACQPKPAYYSSEILPLESGNESSRKQQIVDNMITISSPPMICSLNHAGALNMAKCRGGRTGHVQYFMDKNGQFTEVSKQQYDWIKTSQIELTLNPEFTGVMTLAESMGADPGRMTTNATQKAATPTSGNINYTPKAFNS